MNPIAERYDWLGQSLMKTEERLIQYSKSKNVDIKNGIYDLIDAGGKRIRPTLSIIAAKFGDKEDDALYDVAAISEAIHLGSLIHDDVIDMADLRRGVETLHKKFGTSIAIYAGDIVIMKAAENLSKYFEMDDACKSFKFMSRLIEGEVHQLNMKNDQSITIKDYFRIIDGKTSKLIELSVYLGAKYGNVEQNVLRKLVKIAHYVGMAFQIRDDILDFKATKDNFGKPTYADMKQGYFTLPVILKLKKDPDFINKTKPRGLFKRKVDVSELLTVEIKKSEEIANRFANKAYRLLDELPDLEAKAALRELITYLDERNK